jgi:hypothetical protein
MNIDIGILTETKLPQYHTLYCEDYDITTTEAHSNYIGGVALCVKKSKWYNVEGTCCHGNNVISTQLVSGTKRWLVIGAYIPPSETNMATINHIESAIEMGYVLGIPIILLGDLNVDLSCKDFSSLNQRKMETMALVTQYGL